jgi:diaminopimelate decarboxylase
MMCMTSSMNQSVLNEVAEKYGTPVYVYSEQIIMEQIILIKNSMHPAISWFYSLKANPNSNLVKIIANAGLNLELCSPYELQIAHMIGVSPDRMIYLGPGKTKDEIAQVLKDKIKYFVVESIQEIMLVHQIAAKKREIASIGLRINPNSFIKGARLQMGGKPRQFGIDEEQIDEALSLVNKLPYVQLNGFHSYHGTRILEAEAIACNINYTLSLATRLIKTYDLNISYIDVGGGLGIAYFDQEKNLDINLLGKLSYNSIDTFKQKHPSTQVLMETGRYITAEAGSYIAQVLYTKQSQGIDFAITNGGTHHFAASGNQGNMFMKSFPIRPLYNRKKKPIRNYYISGPLCTPNDLIGREISLPELQPGDMIEVQKSGAYGLTASPTLFLSHPLPSEVLVRENGELLLIRDKDEYSFPIVRV